MIENQLAPMPSGDAGENRSQRRQEHAVRQDGRWVQQSDTPIGARNRDERNSGDSVSPTRDTGADAGHQHQLRRADDTRGHPCKKGRPGCPEPDPQPEGVRREPVEDIDSESPEDQRDGKMNAHRVQRVPGNGNGRGGILLLQLFDHGIVAFGRLFAGHGTSPFETRNPDARRRFRRLAAALTIPLALGACTGDLSALDPAGPYAGSIADLWWIMLIGGILIFAIVILLFMLVLFRPGFGRALTAERWMTLGGLILPLPVLLVLIVYGLAKGEYLLGAWQHEPVIARVEAHASMWNWEFRYPENALSGSSAVLHIPAGGVVEVSVTSADVIHSFWIPRLAGKIDAIPGHTTRLRIKADVPGRYGGICAEYCGTGHAAMRFVVEAHAPDVYRERIEDMTNATAEAAQ